MINLYDTALSCRKVKAEQTVQKCWCRAERTTRSSNHCIHDVPISQVNQIRERERNTDPTLTDYRTHVHTSSPLYHPASFSDTLGIGDKIKINSTTNHHYHHYHHHHYHHKLYHQFHQTQKSKRWRCQTTRPALEQLSLLLLPLLFLVVLDHIYRQVYPSDMENPLEVDPHHGQLSIPQEPVRMWVRMMMTIFSSLPSSKK